MFVLLAGLPVIKTQADANKWTLVKAGLGITMLASGIYGTFYSYKKIKQYREESEKIKPVISELLYLEQKSSLSGTTGQEESLRNELTKKLNSSLKTLSIKNIENIDDLKNIHLILGAAKRNLILGSIGSICLSFMGIGFGTWAGIDYFSSSEENTIKLDIEEEINTEKEKIEKREKNFYLKKQELTEERIAEESQIIILEIEKRKTEESNLKNLEQENKDQADKKARPLIRKLFIHNTKRNIELPAIRAVIIDNLDQVNLGQILKTETRYCDEDETSKLEKAMEKIKNLSKEQITEKLIKKRLYGFKADPIENPDGKVQGTYKAKDELLYTIIKELEDVPAAKKLVKHLKRKSYHEKLRPDNRTIRELKKLRKKAGGIFGTDVETLLWLDKYKDALDDSKVTNEEESPQNLVRAYIVHRKKLRDLRNEQNDRDTDWVLHPSELLEKENKNLSDEEKENIEQLQNIENEIESKMTRREFFNFLRD